MAYPSVRQGQTNLAVKALQNALHRHHAAHGLHHENRRNGSYGELTRRDVARLKRFHDVQPVAGNVAGSRVWQLLEPYLGAYDERLIEVHLEKVERARDAAQVTAAELAAQVGAQAALAAVWLRFWTQCRATYVYAQVRPMPSGLFVPAARTRLDCSSTYKLGWKEAGLPPPDGIPYEQGAGWTGSLWAKGEQVQTLGPGRAAFYGWDRDRGAPRHVACGISSAEVVTFGHTPIEREGLHYRSDLLGIREYPYS